MGWMGSVASYQWDQNTMTDKKETPGYVFDDGKTFDMPNIADINLKTGGTEHLVMVKDRTPYFFDECEGHNFMIPAHLRKLWDELTMNDGGWEDPRWQEQNFDQYMIDAFNNYTVILVDNE